MAAGSARRERRTSDLPSIAASAIARSELSATNVRPARPGCTVAVPFGLSVSVASTGSTAAACSGAGTSNVRGRWITGETTWWYPNGRAAERRRPTLIARLMVAVASARMPSEAGVTRALRPLTRTRIGWSSRRVSSRPSTSVARARDSPPRSTPAEETPFATWPESCQAEIPKAAPPTATTATGTSSIRRPTERRRRP